MNKEIFNNTNAVFDERIEDLRKHIHDIEEHQVKVYLDSVKSNKEFEALKQSKSLFNQIYGPLFRDNHER